MKARLKRMLPSVLWSMPHQDKSIAITVDDGPHPEHTPALLALLAKHDAKATFFMVGKYMQAHPDVVRAVQAAGHEIACHGYTHRSMRHIKKFSEIDAEISQGYQVIQELTQLASQYYRPPHGSLSWRLLAYCLATQKTIAMWSVDSLDYLLSRQDPSVDITYLTNRFVNTVKGGDIILFHDDSSYSLELLNESLPTLAAAGYRFLTLSELKGIKPEKSA